MLKFLISRGLDVNLQSDAGTPLIWAAGHGQQDAVKLLLEYHANVSVILFSSSVASFCCLKSAKFCYVISIINDGYSLFFPLWCLIRLIWPLLYKSCSVEYEMLHFHLLFSMFEFFFNCLQPNIGTEDDITPLLSAVAAGSLPCLELLIQV